MREARNRRPGSRAGERFGRAPGAPLGAGLLVLLGLLMALVGACGGEGAACLDGPRTPAAGDWVGAVEEEADHLIVHARDGRSWRVPRRPRRIVTTLPGLTETVVVLGAADALVAVPDVPGEGGDGRGPGARPLSRISVMPVAWEALTALDPDLVLADAVLLAGALDEMAARLPAVLPLESRSLGHLETSVSLLARVLDTPRARAAAEAFAAELDAARRAAAGTGAGERVLLLAGADPVYALGPGALLDDMLAACGAVNLACDLGRASGPFAPELVRVRRPTWILVAAGRFEPRLEARWAALPAVASGHVADVTTDAFVRAGPRTPGALEALAALFGRENAQEAEDPVGREPGR